MSAAPSILWLKTGPLHPLDTGGKLRTYHMLRELAKTHRITFLALCPPDTEPKAKSAATEYSHEQIWIPWTAAPKHSPRLFTDLGKNLFSPLPYIIQKYQSAAMTAAIQEADRAGRHQLMVCDFLTPAINLFPRTAARPTTKTLLFEHNVESQIWQRLVENTGNPVKRCYFRLQWQRLRRFEAAAARRFDGVVGVSPADCARLQAEFGLPNILGSVPTGVDTEYFASVKGPKQPAEIAFLGSMDWMPNIDAVIWFVAEIFPLVKQSVSPATFTIIGRSPPPRVCELSRRDAAIRVTGTVADIRPHLAPAQAMVVPLRIGGGTRIKIYEAMAAGLPVVSTRIGAEGLQVNPGENILLADTPPDFARQTAALLAQPELGARLGQNGRALVREKFSWAAVTKVFADYCQAVVVNTETVG